jgi:protein-disulfide isomerase
VIPELIKQYVETGKARFVYREFPLTSIHPNAFKASEAAVCAGQQDKYWEMNEHLFATQAEWGQSPDPSSQFKSYAQELGLDSSAFDTCLDSGEAELAVRSDQMAAQTFEIRATPTFFINDLPLEGGRSLEAMGAIIDYVAAGGEAPQILPQMGDWHLRGNAQTAQAITVAFVNYASPESAQHALEVLPELLDQYINDGKLVYILHPWSPDLDSVEAQAAAAAECAGQQDKFWEMHDEIFAQQEAWTAESEPRPLFAGYAQDLDLDAAKFAECLDSDWAKMRVLSGSALAGIYGVPSAPVYLFNSGDALEGPTTLTDFQTIVDSMLNQ